MCIGYGEHFQTIFLPLVCALQAPRRGWVQFQPFRFDFFAAFHAVSVFFVFDTSQCRINLPYFNLAPVARGLRHLLGPVKSPFAKGAPAPVGLVPPGPKQQPSLPKDGGVLNDARQEGLESGCSLYSSYRQQSLNTICARLSPLPLLLLRQGAQVFEVVPTSL